MQGAWFMVVTKTQNCYIYMYSDFLFDVCKRSLELQFTQVAGGQGGGEGYYLHAFALRSYQSSCLWFLENPARQDVKN